MLNSTQVDDNSLVFQSLVPAKNWKIETKALFTAMGISSITVNAVNGDEEESVAMFASRTLFEDL